PVTGVTNGPQKQFDWQVQLYSFDLESSNIFFFWLKEGGVENLGSTKVQTMSSAYFNITDEPLPSSSSALSSTTTTSSSTLSTELSTTDSTPPPSSTSPTSAIPKQQDSEATTDSTPNETAAAAGGGAGDGGGALPVAAQAGIGAGVSIIGLAVIVCGILWFRYLKNQQRILADLHQRAYSQPPDATEMWKLQNPAPTAGQYYHAEMDGNRRLPVEMG
ncbi:hypothetical protein C8A05DRAFT_12639, partial [Staphylotrichum tortipilum]